MAGSIYDDNIEALRVRYGNVVDYLEAEDESNPIPEETDLTAGAQQVGDKIVMCAQKGNITYRLDSLYDNDALSDLWFKGLGEEWNLNSKLIMYGLGNGSLARKFLKMAREDCSIVIHEPSEKMLRAALENFDLTWLFKDLRARLVFWPVFSGKGDIRYFYNNEIIDYKDIESQKITFYPNYPRLFEKDVAFFVEEIGNARDYVVADQVVHDRFGEDFNRNTFGNMMFIPESLSYQDLIDVMPEDVPAIVVAAGPSLDNNIADLKAAEGKCLIISTDTAMKPLALAGITPDIGVIMDGKKDARYMSEESSRNVPLICSPRSGDTFMKLHTGPKFFTDCNCYHIKAFMDKEGCKFLHPQTGGSVANFCFGVAESLHCKRIILVGQDLAYTGDKTHSKVTVRGSVHTAIKDLEHAVMGVDIHGNPIRTSLEFQVYREWFENEIKVNSSLHVIDATEGGVRIEGTTLMTLKDAIAKECTGEFDFKPVLEKVGKLLPENKKQKFIDYISLVPQQLNDLKDLVVTAVTDYKSMRKMVQAGNYHSSGFQKLYRNSRELSEKIENSPVIEYVHNQLQNRSSDMLDTVSKLEKDEKTELLTVCDIAEKYLENMLDALGELNPYVENMKNDLGIGG